MSTPINTNNIERLSGWVKFQYKIWPIAAILIPLFAILAVFYRGRSSSSLSDMPLPIRFAIFFGIALVILAIVFVVLKVMFNSAVNLDTNQIRFGTKEFSFNDVNFAQLTVQTNQTGGMSAALVLGVNGGNPKGRFHLIQPFFSATTPRTTNVS